MSSAIEWMPEAEARLKEIPFFVRPAARVSASNFVAIDTDKISKSLKQY